MTPVVTLARPTSLLLAHRTRAGELWVARSLADPGFHSFD